GRQALAAGRSPGRRHDLSRRIALLHDGPPVRSVHIVLLNWNGKEDTALCLDSLARLEVPAGAEIVTWVVDNGSADGSMRELPPRFPWARFLPIEKNLRYAGGNNRGLQAALAAGADF